MLMVPAVMSGSNDEITTSEMTCPKPPPNSAPKSDVQLQAGGSGKTMRSARVTLGIFAAKYGRTVTPALCTIFDPPTVA